MSNPAAPVFNPNAAHQQKPKLRQVRGFPAKAGEQQVLGLADARQVSDRIVYVAPAVQVILPLMNGERTLDEIVTTVGRGLTRPVMELLVAQLDDAGLLFGPTYEAIVAKMRADFDSSTWLPPGSTAALAEQLAMQEAGEGATEEQKTEIGARRLREVMDMWMAQALKDAPNPSFDALPKAVVAPHIDYQRGWLNYASVWGRMRVVDRPARVVVLGTNHFGEATGVCACDKGYQTPLGTCDVDQDMVEFMRKKLGDALFSSRYDHEREHSIELQIPWIQHCLGGDEWGRFVKVFGVLVHDPSVNNGESYDGKGVAFAPFVAAMREAIAALPGPTLVVSSADLSHVGPAFGDEQALAGETPEADAARNRVFNHDREMIEMLRAGKADELLASMAWQQNPTRWCSLGNMVAAYQIAAPQKVDVLNYAAAMDEEGLGLVSNVGMVMQ